jgi:hypothetical protein
MSEAAVSRERAKRLARNHSIKTDRPRHKVVQQRPFALELRGWGHAAPTWCWKEKLPSSGGPKRMETAKGGSGRSSGTLGLMPQIESQLIGVM